MANSGEELEIKLQGAAADISALRRSRLFASLRNSKSTWERLVSTYYDSPDGALQRAGASLRLREEAGGLVQTIKHKSANGGALARLEDERPLGPADVFPIAPDDATLAALISGADGLSPVARTVTDRWAVTLEKQRTRIEAAFDVGRAEAFKDGKTARTAPLAEAEFELLDGDPEILFKVARLCLDEGEGRLRLAAASKEDQARRLLNGSPALEPEQNLALDTAASAGDVFGAALMASAVRVIEVAPAVTDLRLPEGVHQMRVALRRLRAVVRVFRDAIECDEIRRLARKARKFASALGPARDWDVFLEMTLPPFRARRYEPAGVAAIEARAASLRASAWDEAAATVSSLSFNRFALDLLEAAHVQEWRGGASPLCDEGAAAFAARALDTRLAEVRATASAADAMRPAERHPLRIALKKLRYAAQTFRSLYPREQRKPYMAAMARLQDALGAINDAVVAQGLANEAAVGEGKAAARAAGFLCGFRMAEAEAASQAISETWQAFDAMAPFWIEAAP